MKRLFTLLLLALLVVPVHAEDKEGGIIVVNKGGGLNTLPTGMNQFLGNNGPNPEWETLGGGSGNCTFTRTSAGNYQLNCPLYSGATTTISTTPPPNPLVGQLWFNDVDLQTYIWYDDGTSKQWVAIVNLSSMDSPTFTGTVTFPDGSTWTDYGITMSPGSMIKGPDGGTWSNTGITLPSTSEFTGGSFDLTSGGSWNSSGLTVNNITVTGTTPSIFNNPVTFNNSVNFVGSVTMPDGSVWTSTQLLAKQASFTNLSTVNLSVTGAVNLPSGSITDTMLASGYSGIGTCSAGYYVTTLNRNAAPTCGTPNLSGYLPLSGGTLTGPLTINEGDPQLTILSGTAQDIWFGNTQPGGPLGLIQYDAAAYQMNIGMEPSPGSDLTFYSSGLAQFRGTAFNLISSTLMVGDFMSAPPNTGEGTIYYDGTLHKLRVYTNTGWQTISSS